MAELTEEQIAAGDPAVNDVRKVIEDAFKPFFTGEMDGRPINPKDMEVQIISVIRATIGSIMAINRSRAKSN